MMRIVSYLIQNNDTFPYHILWLFYYHFITCECARTRESNKERTSDEKKKSTELSKHYCAHRQVAADATGAQKKKYFMLKLIERSFVARAAISHANERSLNIANTRIRSAHYSCWRFKY